ncbi:MAG: oligosaccharide flippase family protein [Gaiellaceae bacterium]
MTVPVIDADVPPQSAAAGRALRGGVVRAGGYAAGVLLSLISAPLLIRHLGVAGFGQYVTALSILTIVLGLTEGGLNAAALREYAVLEGPARDYLMKNALGVRFVLTSAGVAGAIAFTAVAGYGQVLVVGVALAGFGLILQLMQSVLSVPLQSELMLGRVSLVEFVRQLLMVALIVVLIVAGAGIVELLAAAIPASAFSLALTAWMVRHLTPLRPTFSARAGWLLLRESVPYAAAIALNVVYFRIALILTSLLSTELETGYFATSFRVIEALVGVPVLVIGAAFPLLVRAERVDGRRFFVASGRLFELGVLCGMWIMVMLETAAPFLIRILAGNAAGPSVAVLRIQALAVAAMFANVACAYALLSLRRYRELLFSNVVALVTSATLVGALAGPFGARGAAIGATVGEIGLATVTALLLLRTEPRIRLPLATVPVATASAAFALFVALALPIHPVAQTVVAGLVFLIVLRLVGRFPPEAWELLHGLRWTTIRS